MPQTPISPNSSFSHINLDFALVKKCIQGSDHGVII
jgi:hypothetical protein